MMNVVVLVGRLVADPQLRQTQQGTAVASFRVAVDRSFAGPNGQRQADFIDCVAWRQSAEFAAKYFQKGSPIAVQGSLQTRQYQDKNGNNRTAVEVVAGQISFVPAPAGWRQGAAPNAAPGAAQTAVQPVFAPAAGESAVYQQQAMPGAGQSHQARAGYAAPAGGGWAQGADSDFAPINDDGDLPF